MGRGRRPAAGKVYYLGRLRYRPGIDPPELEELLKTITTAGRHKRADILRAALLGGAQQAQATASTVEDSEATALLEEMFVDF